jgi:hypothetical protein
MIRRGTARGIGSNLGNCTHLLFLLCCCGVLLGLCNDLLKPRVAVKGLEIGFFVHAQAVTWGKSVFDRLPKEAQRLRRLT